MLLKWFHNIEKEGKVFMFIWIQYYPDTKTG
jgi:hypothetical protein